MMKLKLFLAGIVCLTASNVVGGTLEDMQRLPETIIVDETDETLNFRKGTRPDSFYITENTQLGNSYRQTYQNAICFAAVSHEPANVGRMTRTKIQKHLKEITRFQVTRQDKYKTAKKTFYMNVGATPDQTSVLLLSGQNDSFWKIHVSCQALPQLTEKANGKTAVYWAKKIADSVAFVFKEQKKDK